MATGELPAHVETLADLMRPLGKIPLDRIRLKPLPGTATEKDVEKLLGSADKRICELVDGVLIEKPMSSWESALALALVMHLGAFVKRHKLGQLFGEAGLLRLMPGLIRGPDVSFVSKERLRNHKPFKEKILSLAPDLAVEILSPANTRQEMKRKLKDYFTSGVRLVWIIDPRKQFTEVYTDPETKTRVECDAILDGGDVVPGYKVTLKELLDEINE